MFLKESSTLLEEAVKNYDLKQDADEALVYFANLRESLDQIMLFSEADPAQPNNNGTNTAKRNQIDSKNTEPQPKQEPQQQQTQAAEKKPAAQKKPASNQNQQQNQAPAKTANTGGLIQKMKDFIARVADWFKTFFTRSRAKALANQKAVKDTAKTINPSASFSAKDVYKAVDAAERTFKQALIKSYNGGKTNYDKGTQILAAAKANYNAMIDKLPDKNYKGQPDGNQLIGLYDKVVQEFNSISTISNAVKGDISHWENVISGLHNVHDPKAQSLIQDAQAALKYHSMKQTVMTQYMTAMDKILVNIAKIVMKLTNGAGKAAQKQQVQPQGNQNQAQPKQKAAKAGAAAGAPQTTYTFKNNKTNSEIKVTDKAEAQKYLNDRKNWTLVL